MRLLLGSGRRRWKTCPVGGNFRSYEGYIKEEKEEEEEEKKKKKKKKKKAESKHRYYYSTDGKDEKR